MAKENIKSSHSSPSKKAYKAQRRDLINADKRVKRHAKRIAYFLKRRASKKRNAYLQGRMSPSMDMNMARDHRPLMKGKTSNWVPYTPVTLGHMPQVPA